MAKSSQTKTMSLAELTAKVQVFELILEQVQDFMTKMDGCFNDLEKTLFGKDAIDPGLISQVKLNTSDIKRLNGSITKLENVANKIDDAVRKMSEAKPEAKKDDENAITFKYVLDKFGVPVVTAVVVWLILEGIPMIQAAANAVGK